MKTVHGIPYCGDDDSVCPQSRRTESWSAMEQIEEWEQHEASDAERSKFRVGFLESHGDEMIDYLLSPGAPDGRRFESLLAGHAEKQAWFK